MRRSARLDPIGAAASLGEEVLGAFHGDVVAEGLAEQPQLRAAEAEARLGRVADRAVVLHQEVPAVSSSTTSAM